MIEYRVMICGSRTFNDYTLLKEKVTNALVSRGISRKKDFNIVVVSGGAYGADKLGERFAKEYGLHIETHIPLWNDLTKEPCRIKINKYGEPYNCLAGLNRNKDMVIVSDLVIMFHDGESKGTLNDLDLCKKYNKDYEYILF